MPSGREALATRAHRQGSSVASGLGVRDSPAGFDTGTQARGNRRGCTKGPHACEGRGSRIEGHPSPRCKRVCVRIRDALLLSLFLLKPRSPGNRATEDRGSRELRTVRVGLMLVVGRADLPTDDREDDGEIGWTSVAENHAHTV